MHGRVKTRTTAEENERKKKERAKKVTVYCAGIKKVFDKRKHEELDEEGLLLSGQLLSANPDIYTLWNFRKEILTHLKDELDEENLKRIIETELHLTEVCLRYNPKSYGTWHHRCWLLDNMPGVSWKKEVSVCNKYLDLDERNFHVWDYRRFVVKKAEVESKIELDYTTEKINLNFSNYSAWHYRSKLLPLVHPDPHSVRPIEETVHKNELEMVESAAFTDPSDQSAWFYLRWLLGRNKPDLCISQVVVNNSTVCVLFNQIVSLTSIKITGLGISEWNSANGESFSRVFINKNDGKGFQGEEDVKIIVKSKENDVVLDSVVLNKVSDNYLYYCKPIQFEAGFSASLTAVLEQQLNSCSQLLEFEPDSKWALLTSVYLMQAINRKKYEKNTLNLLGRLMEVDVQRTAYYSDLRSRFHIEYLLDNFENNELNTEFNASGFQLSALYHIDCLMSVQVVDLSDNNLCDRSLPLLHNLIFCKVLKLDKNKIKSLQKFPNLPYLESLSLSNNELISIDYIDGIITSSIHLICLNLCNNPISDSKIVSDKINEFSTITNLRKLKILT